MNRLLHRPIDEAFGTAEAGVDDAGLISSEARLYDYLDTPRDFERFVRFMSLEAAGAALELQAIDSLSAAQARVLESARRAFWLPDFGFQAGVTSLMADGGAGTDSGIALGTNLFELPARGNVDWFVGVNASFPLFEGGAKRAEEARVQEELRRLDFQRDATAERVEQRTQAALHQLQASLLGIDLSRQAAAAAQQNLQLVTVTYRQGAASIIDLLDAQNVALVADEDAATAVYEFLIDLMRVQRSVSRFDFFGAPQDTEAFFERLEAYFAGAGAR